MSLIVYINILLIADCNFVNCEPRVNNCSCCVFSSKNSLCLYTSLYIYPMHGIISISIVHSSSEYYRGGSYWVSNGWRDNVVAPLITTITRSCVTYCSITEGTRRTQFPIRWCHDSTPAINFNRKISHFSTDISISMDFGFHVKV